MSELNSLTPNHPKSFEDMCAVIHARRWPAASCGMLHDWIDEIQPWTTALYHLIQGSIWDAGKNSKGNQSWYVACMSLHSQLIHWFQINFCFTRHCFDADFDSAMLWWSQLIWREPFLSVESRLWKKTRHSERTPRTLSPTSGGSPELHCWLMLVGPRKSRKLCFLNGRPPQPI